MFHSAHVVKEAVVLPEVSRSKAALGKNVYQSPYPNGLHPRPHPVRTPGKKATTLRWVY